MELQEKLYTSTEVAEILGVSLRSIYRYLDENKIDADVKTATGRHRFSKQNILDFLYPEGVTKTIKEVTPSVPVVVADPINITQEPSPTTPTIEDAPSPVADPQITEDAQPQGPVDWLSKFREAAEKYKSEGGEASDPAQEVPAAAPAPVVEPVVPPVPTPAPVVEPVVPVVAPAPVPAEQNVSTNMYYYRSGVGGLKDIAQNLDKGARKSEVDYAFTLQAGLSLHKPIKPFSILHAYVHSADRELFERLLQLSTSDMANSQLCLVVDDSSSIYSDKKEMHGLYVVGDLQLKTDLKNAGEDELASELN